MSVALVAGVVVVILLGLLGYWLFIVTEGAYLGRRIVTLLYDLGASTYDDVKQFSYSDEFVFLAKPLFDRVAETAGPRGLILDVATGTGRLPYALLDLPFFEGHVVAVDASRKMLEQAALKFDAAGTMDRVHLVHHTAVPLPFADASVDAVAMLEALEFLPDREGALQEMVRVLRPGGWFVVSNRVGIDATLMPGRVDAPREFEARLEALGLERVFTKAWQTYYSLVWTRKSGEMSTRGEMPDWRDTLVCPTCDSAGKWREDDSRLQCETCGAIVRRNTKGVWLL